MAQIWRADGDQGAFSVETVAREVIDYFRVSSEAAADWWVDHQEVGINLDGSMFTFTESDISTIDSAPVGFSQCVISNIPYGSFYQEIFDALPDPDANPWTSTYLAADYRYIYEKELIDGVYWVVRTGWGHTFTPYYIAIYDVSDDDTEAAVLIVPIVATLLLLGAFGVGALTSLSLPVGRRRKQHENSVS